jgi:hypothetical protein
VDGEEEEPEIAAMKSRTLKPFISVALAGAFVTAPAWSAGNSLEEGFLHPPPTAYPGGGLNISTNADAVQAQLERQKQLGMHQLAIASGGASGAYMSDAWKGAIASTLAASQAMGFEASFMTSPGFSHTGDSRVQPEEAMKKLVWTETGIPGGRDFNGELAPPPTNSGPFQNIPYFNESPWTLAIDRPFYRDVAVIAYRSAAGSSPDPRPVVTSSSGAVDAARLSANDPRNPIVLDSANGPPWLQLDYPSPRTVRSVVLTTPETLFEESVLGDLSARLDDGTYRKLATFNMRSSAQVTLSFPAVRSSSFRLAFSRLPQSVEPLVPKGGDDIVMNMSNLPFRPKYPASVFAISALTLLSTGRVNEFERKAGFFTFVSDYYALATSPAAANAVTTTADVIDLTGRMQADGTLHWQPPAGDWQVLRIGYTPTGTINHPVPPDATGLEADKLSATHMSKYLNRYLDGFMPAGNAGAGITTLFADSIETGPQNWTDEMFAEFRRRRGYDLHPFMPALTGVIIESAAATDKFLWDYRQTIAELLHENTYARIAELARARGLKSRLQALEQARHMLGDDFEMRRYADEPMGALWASADPVVDYLREYPNQVADLRGAASAAHLYGRKVVASESATTISFPGAFSPRVLKQIVDLEFVLGVNWLSRGAPSPRDLWAPYAEDWLRYLARTSHLLQQGRYVADVAYFYGQEAPLVALRERLNDAPLQYGFDYINATALLNLVSVRDGKLVAPSGVEYRVLQLGGSSRMMTVAVLRRLRALVQAGLVVAGPAPIDSPSLADRQPEFLQLREQLWGADGSGRKLGAGRVYGTQAIASVLEAVGVGPDVTAQPGQVGDTLLFQHRRLDAGDMYYLINRSEHAGPVEFSFRQTGKLPELWRADTGERTPLSYRVVNGRTIVPLDLRQNDALFVVFRRDTSLTAFAAPVVRSTPIARLDSGWSVSFRGKSSEPRQLQPGSWSDSADPGIKYYSGTATYSRTLNVPAGSLGESARIVLDLGEVQDIAEVSVNGIAAGVRWTAPYRFDITSSLKPGDNSIAMKVTNRQVNGLIGAAQSGTPPGFGGYKPSAPLRPSGVIGPVTLLSE